MNAFINTGLFCTIDDLVQEWGKCKKLSRSLLKFKTNAQVGNSWSGLRGRGMEFYESRTYVPQDEIRHIDWKVSARLNVPHTKIFIEERQHPVFLVVDLTSSMRFASKVHFKSVLACKLASIIAWLFMNNNDKIAGIIITDDDIIKIKPGLTKKNLMAFVALLAQYSNQLFLDSKGKTPNIKNWHSALVYLNRHLSAGSYLFIFSDFYWLEESFSSLLFNIKKHTSIHPILIRDPLEMSLANMGMLDMNFQNKNILINSSDKKVCEAYRNIAYKNMQQINKIFNELNVKTYNIFTDDNYLSKLEYLLT